jgi:hypothetical protein
MSMPTKIYQRPDRSGYWTTWWDKSRGKKFVMKLGNTKDEATEGMFQLRNTTGFTVGAIGHRYVTCSLAKLIDGRPHNPTYTEKHKAAIYDRLIQRLGHVDICNIGITESVELHKYLVEQCGLSRRTAANHVAVLRSISMNAEGICHEFSPLRKLSVNKEFGVRNRSTGTMNTFACIVSQEIDIAMKEHIAKYHQTTNGQPQ